MCLEEPPPIQSLDGLVIKMNFTIGVPRILQVEFSGVDHELYKKGAEPRNLGDGSPSVVQGQSPGRGSGDEVPQKLKKFGIIVSGEARGFAVGVVAAGVWSRAPWVQGTAPGRWGRWIPPYPKLKAF